MKILVILVVASSALAAPPYDPDSPVYFESPPPPRPSFLNSYPRYESYLREPDDAIEFDGPPPPAPPPFREGRIIFDDSTYFPSRRPHFYGLATQYIGPPPPAPPPPPTPTEEPRKSPQSPKEDQKTIDVHQLQMTKAYEDQRSKQQQTMLMATTAHHRQPLSFGGHSNHLSFGNHGLGFASVAAATSPDINPLAVSEITATTRAAATGSTASMQPSTSIGQLASQRQNTATESPTSAATPKLAPTRPAVNTANTANTMREVESTTPAGAPKSTLVSIQNSLGNVPSVIRFHEPRITYEIRTVSQDFPPTAHGQLPIEAPRQQQVGQPDVKQNLIVYEAKLNNPFQQQQQQQQSGPLRFSIPTSSIPATLSSAPASSAPIKLEFGSSRPTVTFASAPNTNMYNHEQSHVNVMEQPNPSSAVNAAANGPTYYIVQNNEHSKDMNQAGSGIPIGSYYVLQNSDQVKQLHSAPTGLQLQLQRGIGGIEYFASSTNSEPTKLEVGKVGLNLQEHFQSPAPTYSRHEYASHPW